MNKYIEGLKKAVEIASKTERGKTAAIAIQHEITTELLRQEQNTFCKRLLRRMK